MTAYTPLPARLPARMPASRADTGPDRLAILRSELVKIRTTPLLWWMGATLIIGAVLTAGLFTLAATSIAESGLKLTSAASVSSLYAIVPAFLAVVLIALGSVAVASEYQQHTITTTFLAEPRRLPTVAVKTLVICGWSVVFGVLATGLSTAVAAAILGGHGSATYLDTGSARVAIGGSVVATALWTAFGAGIGWVTRSPALAVGISLGLTQMVEPMARIILGSTGVAPALKFLPGAASDAVTGGSLMSQMLGAELLPPAGGAAVLAGYAAILLAVGAALARREV